MATTLTNRIHIRQLWAQYTDAILASDTRRADTLRAAISRAEREELQAECRRKPEEFLEASSDSGGLFGVNCSGN